MESEQNEPKLTIIIPAYNEEDSIQQVITGIFENVKIPFELIVVDDGSTDRTAEIAQSFDLKLIKHRYNQGYSSALKSGLKIAKGKYILIMDADGTYDTKDIPKLLRHKDKYDMVVGARKTNIPFMRRPAKAFLNILANFLVNKNIPDLNCGLRVFKKDKAMEFMHLYPKRFSFTIIITLAFLTNNYSVKYVPINYHKRIGKSTVRPTNFVDFVNLIIRIMTYFNPFKIFSTIAISLLVLALLVFLFSFFVLDKVMDVTVTIVSLTSLQVFLFGLIADLIVKSRK